MSREKEDRAEVVQHLQMIQAVIARMNGNSFLLKRWGIVLLVALIFYFRSSDEALSYLMVLVIYVPFLVFWGLDTFYLWQERKYRNLHAEVAKRKKTQFDMVGLSGDESFGRVFCSKTIAPLYAIELFLISLIIYLEK